MLSGKLFVICGLSRLAARIARSLRAQNASVTVIMYDNESESLRQILPDGVTVRKAAGENAAETLRTCGVANAECLLAVAEEDIVNLRSTVAARSVAPHVPVVIRAFDPKLADEFEQGLNVRRAFSVSALAAPAFAAAACGAAVIESLRLGDDVVPINCLPITRNSHLLGARVGDLESVWRVHLVALRRASGAWMLGGEVDPADSVLEGDELVVSGASQDCMNLLAHAAGWHHRRRMNQRKSRRGFSLRGRGRRIRRRITWLPQLATALILLVLTAVLVFKRELHLSLVNSIYFVITTLTTTGYGDISVSHAPDWVKLFDGLIMLSGGALLGIMFSYLASVATAERLDLTMTRRAEQMSNHIVVVGLGNVGYRVSSALCDLGLDVAVLDLAPRARFFDSVSKRAPVLTGDARLQETLESVSIRSAAAVIACTSDDLANIEACLHARRMNPMIHTVARVYDDQIVATLSSAFNIDAVLSATHAAESSFVMAATDAAALRPLNLDGLPLQAARYRVNSPISASEVEYWRKRGIQAVAYRPENGAVSSELKDTPSFEAIVIGDEAALREILRDAESKPRNQAAAEGSVEVDADLQR